MSRPSTLLPSILRSVSLQRTVLPLALCCVLPVLLAMAARAQTYTVLHNFTGGADGGSPSASLTLGGRGTLYGTTVGGGAGQGVAFQITHETGGWVLASLYAFGGFDGAVPQAPLVFGPGGLVFGSTTNGGNLRDESCFYRGCGVVFTLQPPPTACHAVLCHWIETPIYTFTTLTDGFEPAGNLAFDQVGNLYGTTIYGGSSGGCYGLGCGTVFQLTRSGSGWTKTTLYSFNGGSIVAPVSGVIIDRSGVLYGTTAAGGLFSQGTVFTLTPSGSGFTFNLIYNFHNGSDGGDPEGGLVMDAAGNLYGTTRTGGSGGGGTVFELSPSGGGWTYSVLASFSGYHGSTGTLAFDSAGNLYGTTRDDGAYHYGNVFKLTHSGGQWTYSDLYDFTGGNDGGEPSSGVTLDSSGNIFGTALWGPIQGCSIHGAPYCGVVWEITP